MLKRMKHFTIVNLILIIFSQTLIAGDLERRQAKRIHDRLTGIPPTNAKLAEMETLLMSDSTGVSAAQKAVENPAFYNVTLKNFIAPWTNEEQTVFVPLNDYTATTIGLIRDGEDFRKILTGDVLYTGNSSLGISPYSPNNNDHYEQLEALGPVAGNLADPAILQTQIQSNLNNIPVDATAGVITSRAAAKAFFIDGTNRAMFRFTFVNHLCTDLEPLKDNSRPSDKVRQDVSRSPGGDSRIYINSCLACHAGMDGLDSAYAHYDYDKDAGRLDYNASLIQPKHLINPDNFKPGFIITDDSWVNYWRNGQNSLLGWGSYPGLTLDEKGNAIGNGLKSMGQELANSDAFAQCQVKKVFETICFRNPDDYAADRAVKQTIVTDFKTDYNLLGVFTDVAAYCKGN